MSLCEKKWRTTNYQLNLHNIIEIFKSKKWKFHNLSILIYLPYECTIHRRIFHGKQKIHFMHLDLAMIVESHNSTLARYYWPGNQNWNFVRNNWNNSIFPMAFRFYISVMYMHNDGWPQSFIFVRVITVRNRVRDRGTQGFRRRKPTFYDF